MKREYFINEMAQTLANLFEHIDRPEAVKFLKALYPSSKLRETISAYHTYKLAL